MLRVTGLSPAPPAGATGALSPEAASLQQIINSSRFCSSACGPPGTSKTRFPQQSLSFPFYCLFKDELCFPLQPPNFARAALAAAELPGLSTVLPRTQRGSSPTPVLACECSATEGEATGGSDAMGTPQGKGQPCSSAGLLPTWERLARCGRLLCGILACPRPRLSSRRGRRTVAKRGC